MKTGQAKPDVARAILRRRRPQASPEISHLKVVVGFSGDPHGRRTVQVANLPSEGQSTWVLRELSACHPEYHFWTPDGEQIPVRNIIAYLEGGEEKSFEPAPLASVPEPFRPLRVVLDIGRGAEVEMANIPATESGLRLVRRLISQDSERERKVYTKTVFMTTDYGWMPVGKIKASSLVLPAA